MRNLFKLTVFDYVPSSDHFSKPKEILGSLIDSIEVILNNFGVSNYENIIYKIQELIIKLNRVFSFRWPSSQMRVCFHAAEGAI